MSINNEIRKNIEKYCSADVSAMQKRVAEEYSQIGDHPLYGGKYAGSDAELAGAAYIAEELEKIGVDRIEVVEFDSCRFQHNDAQLKIVSGECEKNLFRPGPYPSPGTSEEGITAELIDIGFGRPEDLEGADVSGKIVLIESQPGLSGNTISYSVHNVQAAGAAAVIFFQSGDNLDSTTLKSGTFMEIPKIPVTGLNTDDIGALREALGKGKVTVNLTVDAEYLYDSPSRGVIAEIKGKTDERIVFSGHIDHYFRCMQDNISSVTGMLGIAKSIVDSGYKPNRTITFMFTSSHEVSGKESLNPYIYGSYVMLCEKHPEWIDDIIYDINFEYSALKEKALRSYGSPEAQNSYNDFIEYMSEETPGFDFIAKDFDPASYILMAWEDSVSYVASGVTAICNDPITEQMSGDSPYIGRDHSTSDNMESFDHDTLTTTTKWYGSLGIYLDQKPVPELDFRGRTTGLRLEDNEKGIAEAAGCDISGYDAALDSVYEKAGTLYELITAKNGERTELTEEDVEMTYALGEIRRKYSALTDTFNAVGFFAPYHKKYMMSCAVLSGAIELLKAGDLENAVNNCLVYADFCGVAYEWGIETGKMIEKFAADEDRRTWNRGKTSSILVLPEAMESLRKKRNSGITAFDEEIAALQEALASETEHLTKSFEAAIAVLKEIDSDMAAFLRKYS